MKFSLDNGLWRIMNFLADMVILHFLWVVTSLPIITIGASTTALYDAQMRLIRTREGYAWKNFLKAFRANFRQATVIWMGMLLMGGLFITDMRVALHLQSGIRYVMIGGLAVLLLPMIFICLYIFPVQAKFENRIFDNLKNAIILSLRHFLSSLLLIVITLTFVVASMRFRWFIGLMLLMGSSLYTYLNASVFVTIFRQYVPDELNQDLEKSGEKFEL